VDTGTWRGTKISHARIGLASAADARRVSARAGIGLLVAVYILGWAVIGRMPLNATDLDVFFLPSARIALDGHPLLVYSLRYADLYPNANGPLALLPLTAVAAVIRQLGWLDNPELRRMLVMAAFAVFPLLMAREALLAVDRLLVRPVRPLWRIPLGALFALSPILWLGMLGYGHIEQPIMLWLLLAGVRQLAAGRSGRAGALLGLALLTRSSAVVYLAPLIGLHLRHGRWRAAGTLAATAAGTLALGLLPFALADRADLMFSLVTFHAELPVGGGSLWGLAVNTPLEAVAMRYDSWVVLGASVLVAAAALALRREMDVRSADVYALLALCGCCFPLLIKTTWPYYFLEAYVFVGIWWAAQATASTAAGDARRRRGRVVWWLGLAFPAGLSGLAALLDYGVTLRLPTGALPAWSALTAGLGLLFAAALALAWAGVARARPRARGGPAELAGRAAPSPGAVQSG